MELYSLKTITKWKTILRSYKTFPMIPARDLSIYLISGEIYLKSFNCAWFVKNVYTWQILKDTFPKENTAYWLEESLSKTNCLLTHICVSSLKQRPKQWQLSNLEMYKSKHIKIHKSTLLLLVNFVSEFRLELMYISLIISIRLSLIHLHGFQLLVLLR